MNYYVEVRGNKKNTADMKAPADMCRIMHRRGYRCIRFRPIKGRSRPVFRLTQLMNWTRAFCTVGDGDLLVYQYPLDLSKLSILLFRNLMRLKRTTVVLLIHDIDSIRGYYSAEENARKEVLLKEANFLICHNYKMRAWLAEAGIPAERIIPMGAFDYLLGGSFVEPSNLNSVIIAGNLSMEKSPYLAEYLAMEKDYLVNLYGPYFEPREEYRHYRYFGSFPPEELPGHLQGGFGLVWDGISVDECAGLRGAYLRYNNPHKAFSYLASGIPVIIWDQAALADYICQNGLGFTVGSLHEVSQKLKQISRDDWLTLCRNARAEGEKLRRGYYLNRALDRIEEMR